jgi:hypothetical protein
MDLPRRSQKQISKRYWGNLRYYARTHLGRLARFLVTFLAVAAGIAAIIVYQRRGNERFFNPGQLSASHAALADKSAGEVSRLTPVTFQRVLSDRFHNGIDFAPIDRNCAACHLKQDKRVYDFHEPNVAQNRSCSVCHQEHRGAASLQRVASSQCASCHDDPQVMKAASQKGMKLRWETFQRHPQPPRQVVFQLPRPPRGYTQTFAAFWDGHPEFQIKREPARDPDMLKFNHERHFQPDIPPIGGKKLECSYCHQPDLQGRYNMRITFAGQCQVCHSLQFDPKNPELTLPHGDTTAVRGFLEDLQAHYADLAIKKGLPKNLVQAFVTQQMMQLRDRLRVTYPAIPPNLSAIGDAFEHQVFFVADPYKPQSGTVPARRAFFYGCALCHDPQPRPGAAPFIAKPVFVDRWMVRSDFNHATHRMVKCDDCHHARRSRLTSDVLMPGISSCVTCHSPKGKVAAECITCHNYHAPASLILAQGESVQR